MTSTTPADGADLVDRHLADAPEPQRTTLGELRTLLHRLVPDGVDGIKYGMPALLLDGAGVAGYESFRSHCGYYPFSGSVLGARCRGRRSGGLRHVEGRAALRGR